jgi:hypothetical protein
MSIWNIKHLTTYNGTTFIERKMVRYVNSRNIKLLTSTLYYAQANGQVEAINKILINLIKKNIKDKPRNWHETFTQVFWAYRILKVQHVLHYIDVTVK